MENLVVANRPNLSSESLSYIYLALLDFWSTMLPLSLLKTAEGHPMLIEMKNGDTYNGRLVSCNMFMNICLRDVICTSKVRQLH